MWTINTKEGSFNGFTNHPVWGDYQNKRRTEIMGYAGCPCYRDYIRMFGHDCDDISCANCPLLEVARRKNQQQ
ncbi:hypothetical protein AGMMS49928_25040 [Spirochaetia bacterium]|nr:hypothetical protein AGMMS49928_25040 [Spirochaetia bacterium]